MKRRKIILISTIIPIILIVISLCAYANYFGPQTVIQTNSDKENCRQGNIFDGVDRQARFKVLSTCEKVIGIVHDMKGTREHDGDYHFNLKMDKQYNKLLNQENINQVNGMLVMEIVPKDQNSSQIQIPKNGERIEAIGAWVTDNPQGWNEIHPIWKLKVL